MANTVIPHSSREHRERQKESRCAVRPAIHPPIRFAPSLLGAARRCIFRREACRNSGTLTPEAGFWMGGDGCRGAGVGGGGGRSDATRPLTQHPRYPRGGWHGVRQERRGSEIPAVRWRERERGRKEERKRERET